MKMPATMRLSPLEKAFTTLYQRYTEEQLALIHDFTSRANAAIHDHIAHRRATAGHEG